MRAQFTMRADCDSFRERVRSAGFEGLLVDRAGDVAHDFWLTRCHHGSGFWDGHYAEPAGTELTKIAHSFGERTCTLATTAWSIGLGPRTDGAVPACPEPVVYDAEGIGPIASVSRVLSAAAAAHWRERLRPVAPT